MCNSEGRSGSPTNKIGAALIRLKRITHSGVGGVTRGQWLVEIVSDDLWGGNMIRSQVLGEL